MKLSNIERYETTHNYKSLLNVHSLTDYGIWNVFGEDANCDMGGAHFKPNLGLFEGKLQDVLKFAVELPNFWTWGIGGDVRYVTIKKIDKDSEKIIAALRERKTDMEAQLKIIEQTIRELI